MSQIPVKDHSGLFRDSNTGAIISKNKNDFQKYIENRNRMLNQSEKVEKLEKNKPITFKICKISVAQ